MLVTQIVSYKKDCFTIQLPDFACFLFSFLGEDFKVEVRDAPHGMMPPHKSTPKRVEHQANRVSDQWQNKLPQMLCNAIQEFVCLTEALVRVKGS